MRVIALAVISLDGRITHHDREGIGFASPADQAFFQQELAQSDCIVMGRKTFEAAQERILSHLSTTCLRVVLTHTPQAFQTMHRPGQLEFWSGSMPRVIRALRDSGRTRCTVVGGGALFSEGIQWGVIQELWLTLEPLGFGEGKPLFRGQVDFHFEFVEMVPLSSQTLLIKYRNPLAAE